MRTRNYITIAILINLNISSSTISIFVLHIWYISGFFRALNYCTGGLAYTTLRFLIASCILTIARYVDITTMQGTKKIVRNNIILFNIK